MTLRVVFFGNRQSVFSSRHFQALLDSGAGLAAVVDTPAHKRSTSNPLPARYLDIARTARERGIPCRDPADPADEEVRSWLADLEPDLFLAVGYARILKAELLEIPRRLAANFHASLLPHYRGMHPVFWALRAGEPQSGLTVHVMDAGIDSGDILYQVKVRTRKDDSVASLYGRIMDRSEALVGRLITDLEQNALTPRRQPAGEGSYFSAFREEDFALQWDWPAEKLRRFVAVTPGKCFAKIQGQRGYFLNGGTFLPEEKKAPGTLMWLGRTRAGIATGEGGFWSSRVLVQGQGHSMAGLCRALGLAPGDRLG